MGMAWGEKETNKGKRKLRPEQREHVVDRRE